MINKRKAAKIFGVFLLLGFVGLVSFSLYLYRWSTPYRESALSIDLGEIEHPPNNALTPDQKAMIIARIDPRFYEHKGIDFRAITKAIVFNHFRDDQAVHIPGTNTLSLSVALNLLPEPHTGKAIYNRAITSFFLASRLEDHFTKVEIFRLYVSMEDPRMLDRLTALPNRLSNQEIVTPIPFRVD